MIAWELSCAILILVALALRFLFRKKLGATARYALWAVVLLRLLLPMSIGQARISVPGALEKVSARLERSDSETPLNDSRALAGTDASDVEVTGHKAVPTVGQTNSTQREGIASGSPAGPARAAAPAAVPWTKVVRIVWIIGIGAVALWFTFVNLRFARTLRRGRTRIDSDAPLPVYLASGAETPCLFGLFRPAVYLPPEVAGDEALRRFAVAHELTHDRHGDHIWAAARCLCVALHWWNPLVWVAAVCSRRDAELACDEGTLVRLGASERRPYGEALIRMTVPEKSYLLHAATMMSGNDLKERIKMIAQDRKTVRTALIAAAALLVLAALFVFAGNAGGSRLFDRAAPNKSAMTLYRLDEDGGKAWNLYDSAKEKEILSRLKKVRAVPAPDRIPDEISYPLYALEIGTPEGNTIRFLWHDGDLIDWRGNAYAFEFPFESLLSDDWRYIRSFESLSDMPNGGYLAQTGGKWYAERLTPAREADRTPPDGLSMTVTQITAQAVTVTIENRGSETWYYGDPYAFEVLLDGAWYQVPLRPGDRNIGFNEIAWTLEPGKTVGCTCSLSYYAPLPPGVYRVVKSGLTAPFELFADGSGMPGEAMPQENGPVDVVRAWLSCWRDDTWERYDSFWTAQKRDDHPLPAPNYGLKSLEIEDIYIDDSPWFQTYAQQLMQDWGLTDPDDLVSVIAEVEIVYDGALVTPSDGAGVMRLILIRADELSPWRIADHERFADVESVHREDRMLALPDVESLQALQQSDPARFTALMQAWSAQVDMIGEQFVSEAGEAGNWWDVRAAFAERWCQKHLNASEESPYRCADAGVWALGNHLNAVSLTGAPRRLAFDVTLALGFRTGREELFEFVDFVSGGWARKNENGLMEISTEAVLVSDDDVHWTVESLNTGGTGGWGWRHLPRADEDYYMREILPYILSSLRQGAFGAETNLIQFVPNLDWSRLSTEEFNAAAAGLRAAAVKTEELDFGENDQLYRDLYMLWGFKNADGAYAALFLDGPDSLLAIQQRADPETFAAALAEMDAQTQETVRRALGI